MPDSAYTCVASSFACELGYYAHAHLRPFDCQRGPHLLRHIPRLVRGEMVLTPQFFCGIDDTLEALR
jgi:hypothetical protein